MVTPCKKCGATKTEAVHHGLMYNLARTFGYRLRKCSRCFRLRLIPRHAAKEPEHADEEKKQVCPRCGSDDYRKSHRRLWERMPARPPMVRCRRCRERYPRPHNPALAF